MKYIFLIITVLFLLSCNSDYINKLPKISSAEIDLYSNDFNKSGPINLDGNWEFYWLRLYTSEDFKKEKIPVKRFAHIPGSWSDEKTISDKIKFSALGHATYRLNIKLKNNISYGLKLQEMNCAYNLYINGKLVSSNGTVADNPGDMKPQFAPKFLLFYPESDNTELILQVSNYSYIAGGSLHSIVIGTELQIVKKRENELVKDLIIFGMIFIIGIYHFMIYFIKRKDLSLLFYSIGSISLSVRLALQREMFFASIYPDLNWNLLIFLSHVSSYIAGLSLMLFLWTMFKNDINRLFITAHIIITSSYIIMMIFTPAVIYSSIQTPFLIFYILSLLYLSVILIIIVKKKRKFSLILLSGFIILSFSIINDQLVYMGVINTENVISFGMIFFIFSQAITLSMKFKYAYDEVENLSYQLIDENIKIEMINLELEENVFKRTKLINWQKSILDDQIMMAKKIQQTIIPADPPKLKGLDISLKNKPMMNISSDFVDFIVKNDKEVGLFICDVSGQGVPGALLASMVKISLIHQWCENIDKPELVLKNIHDSISLNLGGNFITAVVCYINIETGKFIFSNAGHSPLLYIKNNNEIIKLQTKGKAIYNHFKPDYEEFTIDLKSREKILMYSDGIMETPNRKNEFYDEERLKRLLLEKKNSDTENLCKTLLQDVMDFISGNDNFNDDVTFLAIEYKGLKTIR